MYSVVELNLFSNRMFSPSGIASPTLSHLISINYQVWPKEPIMITKTLQYIPRM